MSIKNVWDKLYPCLPAGVWYGIIFSFSAQTGDASGALSDGLAYKMLETWRPSFFLRPEDARAAILELLTFCIRKASHMGVYFILMGLLLLALRRFIARPGRRAAAAVLLAGLLAGLDEFHQTFVPGRSGQLQDVCIDLAGACFCLLIWGVFKWRSAKRAKKQALSKL